MAANKASKKEIRMAKKLLKAVMANDARAVDLLMETHANPNCVFDNIPLLAVAAAQGTSLDIIRSLIAHGADPTLGIKANVKDMGKPLFALTKDPATRSFLKNIQNEAFKLQKMNVHPAYEPALHITLGQFCYEYHSLEMKDPKFYTDPDYTGPAHGKGDNRLNFYIEPDRMPCLLDNIEALTHPSENDQEATATKLIPGFNLN